MPPEANTCCRSESAFCQSAVSQFALLPLPTFRRSRPTEIDPSLAGGAAYFRLESSRQVCRPGPGGAGPGGHPTDSREHWTEKGLTEERPRPGRCVARARMLLRTPECGRHTLSPVMNAVPTADRPPAVYLDSRRGSVVRPAAELEQSKTPCPRSPYVSRLASARAKGYLLLRLTASHNGAYANICLRDQGWRTDPRGMVCPAGIRNGVHIICNATHLSLSSKPGIIYL